MTSQRKNDNSRNTDETANDLRYMAETLIRLATSLKNSAERMDKKIPRITTINVRYGVGTHKALTEKLTPFCQDAAKKVSIAGG